MTSQRNDNGEEEKGSMYYAKDLAAYIVTKCIEDGEPISNLYLQKILYSAQELFLTGHRERLIADEFEAFGFGACVPNVYYSYCHYGVEKITMERVGKVVEIDPVTKSVVDGITEMYRRLKPWEIPQPKAWEIIWDNGKGKERVIPVELIMDVYDRQTGRKKKFEENLEKN